MALLSGSCLAALFLFTGCQIEYLVKSGYHQAEILRARIPLDEALKDPKISDDVKKKLSLAHDASRFASTDLGLKHTENYTSYVQLPREYVSYAVSAAPRFELTHHLWSYPLVGKLPYKGFFTPEEANEEARQLEAEGLDTYVRGVTAYSTLGWFKDPILSSMMRMQEHDLVDTIIHETVHATLYIKSAADFNERLAVFLAARGTELFYLKREGPASPTLEKIKLESEDLRLFSKFISGEIDELNKWYASHAGAGTGSAALTIAQKSARIQEIQSRFIQDVIPQMKTKAFTGFAKESLNNAKLLSYQTYFMDLSVFEKKYEQLGRNFARLLEYCKSLEKEQEPEKVLERSL